MANEEGQLVKKTLRDNRIKYLKGEKPQTCRVESRKPWRYFFLSKSKNHQLVH